VVAAGQNVSLALKADGTIVGWGTGGAIPKIRYINPDASSTLPMFPTNVVAIAAGSNGSCMILADGRVIAWGTFGTGADGPLTSERSMPASATVSMRYDQPLILRRDGIASPSDDVPLGIRPAILESGGFGSLVVAVLGDGTVTAWGYNNNPGTNLPPRLRSVSDIGVGDSHALAVRLPTPPVPTRATATAQVVNGFVVGLNVIDGGEGYAVPPQVTISGGSGGGATATAQISKGVVTGFTITNAGIGYTSAPTVTIDPPPFLPRLTIATSRVGVTMQVVRSKRYQLESSNDLPNFGPVGTPFVADTDTISQEFTVSETGQFFRIVEVP
jgi:hypothetical protein